MEEVTSSSLVGSTSLRSQRVERAGSFGSASQRMSWSEGCRAEARRAEADCSASPQIMKYVYVLQSSASPVHFYIGIIEDVAERQKQHNNGHVNHTAKYKPWRIKTYVTFSDDKRAIEFEKYLKSGSG